MLHTACMLIRSESDLGPDESIYMCTIEREASTTALDTWLGHSTEIGHHCQQQTASPSEVEQLNYLQSPRQLNTSISYRGVEMDYIQDGVTEATESNGKPSSWRNNWHSTSLLRNSLSNRIGTDRLSHP
ncbi:unnamed protein product [Protopolystoma xenopodis]|uniref:Uncharacterized protein n=1 Tax=Protopolystoma xenopodis TaxID=117903 RepID=A0A448WFP1_9PLAT|nr:unnamed protein product [Protopolystoma xenopodis]